MLARLKRAPLPGRRPSEAQGPEALLEWNERALSASEELGVAVPALRALARVALMSGTAVAVFAAAERKLAHALVAFAVGCVSCLWVAQTGRRASALASNLKSEWHRAGRRG